MLSFRWNFCHWFAPEVVIFRQRNISISGCHLDDSPLSVGAMVPCGHSPSREHLPAFTLWDPFNDHRLPFRMQFATCCICKPTNHSFFFGICWYFFGKTVMHEAYILYYTVMPYGVRLNVMSVPHQSMDLETQNRIFPSFWSIWLLSLAGWTLQWRHNEGDGISNHRRLDCLFNRLFRRISKKTSKLCVTGFCEGNHR